MGIPLHLVTLKFACHYLHVVQSLCSSAWSALPQLFLAVRSGCSESLCIPVDFVASVFPFPFPWICYTIQVPQILVGARWEIHSTVNLDHFLCPLYCVFSQAMKPEECVPTGITQLRFWAVFGEELPQSLLKIQTYTSKILPRCLHTNV